jgi:hypothetical protein
MGEEMVEKKGKRVSPVLQRAWNRKGRRDRKEKQKKEFYPV